MQIAWTQLEAITVHAILATQEMGTSAVSLCNITVKHYSLLCVGVYWKWWSQLQQAYCL